MVNFSIINLSKTTETSRLDAEYYQTLYVNFEKKFNNPLSIADYVREGYRVVYETTEVFNTSDIDRTTRFLQSSDIKTPMINLDTIGYVSNLDWERYKKGRIHRGEILIEVKGNAEKVSLVPDDFPEKTLVTGTLYKIDVSPERSKEYLLAYLISKYGVAFRNRVKTNLMVAYINKSDLYNIPVPTPSNTLVEKIESLVTTSIKKYSESKIKYQDAENILLSELGLKGYVSRTGNISIRDFAECLRDDRLDAEYWQPEYEAMEKAVSKVAQRELGEIVSVSKGVEIGSEAYETEGKPFIRVSDFSIYGMEDAEKKMSPELYEQLKDKYTPKKGEVLFTKDGTIGLSYALQEDTAGILSGAFLRLKPTIKINTTYLALVLNSTYCKSQIERMSGGAIIAHLKPESAKKIKIPLLSEAKQEEIAEKVSTAFRMRKEAQELLSKAKHAVEIFIEKNEAEALNCLAT